MHRRPPHLHAFDSQPIVYLTACTEARRPILHSTEVHEALRATWMHLAHHAGWIVGRYVVMPDHLHLFARPRLDACPLGDWVRRWKTFSARTIKRANPKTEHVWQRDYFDRFLRSGESYAEKWNYVLQNPVRAGLVDSAEEWPYGGVIEELRF